MVVDALVRDRNRVRRGSSTPEPVGTMKRLHAWLVPDRALRWPFLTRADHEISGFGAEFADEMEEIRRVAVMPVVDDPNLAW